MSDDLDAWRRALLASEAKIPTGLAGRLGRTALAGWRARRALSGKGAEDVAKALELASALGRLKGIGMKMGQIMSYIDVALPEEAGRALSVLQTHAQAMPEETVRAEIQAALGPRAEALLSSLEPEPISAASIGQVHRAHLPDGTPVAVKVRYPEIEAAIEADFRAAGIAPMVARLIYPGSQIEAMIEEAHDRFLAECDYALEARTQAAFRGRFDEDPDITIPAVHPAYSAGTVLTTTYVEGQGLEALLATEPSQADRDRLGQALFRFYVGSLFEHGLYNCDPHPGNQLYLPDGRVAILDHGCSRRFEEVMVARLARLTLAMHAGEADAIETALVDLDVIERGDADALAIAIELLEAFYGPTLNPGRRPIDLGAALDARDILDGKRQLMTLNLPGAFLFLLRIRFGLFAVLDRLGAEADWQGLEERLAQRALDRA